MNAFEYRSSPIKWCEAHNHTHDGYLIEIWNTVSSLVFCCGAIYGLKNYHNQIHKTRITVICLYFLLFFIGVGSVWFHATLSLMGQIMDELGIIWLMMLLFITDTHHNFTKFYLQRNNGLMIPVIIISTYFIVKYPQYNAINLMILGILLAYYTYNNLKNSRFVTPLKNATILLIAGIIAWIFDKKCFYQIHTHWIWHICISISGLILVNIWSVRIHDIPVEWMYFGIRYRTFSLEL